MKNLLVFILTLLFTGCKEDGLGMRLSIEELLLILIFWGGLALIIYYIIKKTKGEKNN